MELVRGDAVEVDLKQGDEFHGVGKIVIYICIVYIWSGYYYVDWYG